MNSSNTNMNMNMNMNMNPYQNQIPLSNLNRNDFYESQSPSTLSPSSMQKTTNPQFIYNEKLKAMFATIIEKERFNNSTKILLLNCPNFDLLRLFQSLD